MQRLKNKIRGSIRFCRERAKEFRIKRIISIIPSVTGLIRNVQLIQTPTPDDIGQPIHPSLVSLPSGYAMAFTPYPNSNSSFEWPCVVQSTKLPIFEPFGAHSLPVVKHTQRNIPGDYLNDPELYFDRERGELWLYYIESLCSSNKVMEQNLILQKSINVNTWGRPIVVRHDKFISHNDNASYLVSPSILKTSNGYFLYAVDLTKKRKIVRLESADGHTWSRNKIDIRCKLPHNLIPWHISVFSFDGVGYLLISATLTYDIIGNVLLLANSNDLTNWQVSPRALLKPSKALFDSKLIYRSSAIVEDSILKLLFSFKDLRNQWNTGYGDFLLSEIR